MKHYIIDGNNLIGKIPSISAKQAQEKQAARESLAFLLERFFARKKASVILHFDGYESTPIKVSGIKIVYSLNREADQLIKSQIEKSSNRKNIILVTSDNNLIGFGRVCSCEVIKSEEFARELFSGKNQDDEEARIKAMNDVEEFKKLFNTKNKTG